MNWFLMGWQRALDFEGRSRRKEYWMFSLFNFLIFAAVVVAVAVVFMVLGVAADSTGTAAMGLGVVGGGVVALYALASLLPGIALAIRRLHDTNRSGWWLLISLVPLGGIVMLVFMLTDGTPGDNSFGPDPKSTGVEMVPPPSMGTVRPQAF
jgi:uncharacterized membrane protein YhaH (DUF805 family)